MKTINLTEEQVDMLKSVLTLFIDYIGSISTQVEKHCEENELDKSTFIEKRTYTDLELAKKLLEELNNE